MSNTDVDKTETEIHKRALLVFMYSPKSRK
jgi:hypothetical protein